MSEPVSRFYTSQGLRLHFSDWGNEGAPPLLLLHGGRDHGRSLDAIAHGMRDTHHVMSLDWRGHGDSEWAKASSYCLPDFVCDLDAFYRDQKLTSANIVCHSMGGGIAMLFAGVYPGRVDSLFVIEGLRVAMPKTDASIDAELADWIGQIRSQEGRRPRPYASVEDAFKRMKEAHPRLTDAQARHLTVHGLRANGDGTHSWKHDDSIRLRAPYSLSPAQVTSLWNRISCPTLLVRGTKSGRPDPAANGWLQHFRTARTLDIEGAGHWVHHDYPDKIIAAIRDFLRA